MKSIDGHTSTNGSITRCHRGKSLAVLSDVNAVLREHDGASSRSRTSSAPMGAGARAETTGRRGRESSIRRDFISPAVNTWGMSLQSNVCKHCDGEFQAHESAERRGWLLQRRVHDRGCHRTLTHSPPRNGRGHWRSRRTGRSPSSRPRRVGDPCRRSRLRTRVFNWVARQPRGMVDDGIGHREQCARRAATGAVADCPAKRTAGDRANR